ATSNGRVVLWNHQSGTSTSIAAHSTEVNALSFDRAGKLLATAGDDGTVRVWQVDSARPYWRAPVLLKKPLRLLTHRGWQKNEQAPKPRIRDVLEERTQYAEQSDDGIVCMRTYDGKLEAWDLEKDERLVERKIADLEDVVAVPGGCASRADGGVRIYARDGKVRQLALQAEAGALAYARDRVLVAAGEQVVVFDATGNERERVTTGVGVTALGIADIEGTPLLVVGYQDGNLELFALGGAATKSFTFEGVPSSAATRLVAGPRDSVIAGFANGTVGLWSLRDGKRLASGRVHGSIAHLVLEGGKLYAASTLGRVLSWELGPFYADRCTLLEDVWRKVPITWQSGRALESPPPSDHACRQ
ncbi:MAG TPA: hypothetical protein VFB62_25800, partial [Polyangiaceae bacterium]|nr:hypothetical protein [Polyangiaceae bacterium]